MYAGLRLSVIDTLWASQDHLNMKEHRSQSLRIHLFEQPRVEIVGACESRNTQQRCSSNEQKWAYSLIEESSWFRAEIQG